MRIPRVHKLRTSPLEKSKSNTIDIDLIENDTARELTEEIIDDKKEFRKMLVILKRLCRGSFEYQELMKFLKYKRGLFRCGIHQNITIWDNFNIHIHHTPFTLEDIISIVVYKRLAEDESLKMMDICNEVMMLHYLEVVGLYPLCETCHEYAHGDTNDLFIPLDVIYGDPEAFFEIYKKYIPEPLVEKFEKIRDLTQGLKKLEETIPQNLIRKYIYIKYKKHEMMSSAALSDAMSKFL